MCASNSMIFFFNDTATTEIYTPFPTRRSSDLSRAGLGFGGDAERGDEFDAVGGGEITERVMGRDHLADRKSTRLNSSHQIISYAVFCLKKKIYTPWAYLATSLA